MAKKGVGIANGSSAGKRKRGGDDSYGILVKTSTGEIINLQVKPSDSIRNVKVKIHAKKGIPPDQQALIFNKMVLQDSNYVQDFEIKKDSLLKLLPISRGLIRIFVNIPRRTTISLEAKPSDTIGNVKAMIWAKEGIPPEEQVLIFNKIVLEDSGTLVDFDIKKDSTLKLMFKSGGSMKIFVKTLSTGIGTGTRISLMVKPTDTICNIKEKIKFKLCIPLEEQVLTFNEMLLDDNSTLADFQINMESTLKLMRKSRGLIKIYVNCDTGTIILEVKPLETIENRKATIREKKGIPSCHQLLIVDGMRLEDEYTLADYDIHQESTIDLTVYATGS